MNQFQYKLYVPVIFIFLIAQKANATDYSSEQDFFQEFPVVLSASRLLQPLSETPNAMTVIDRKMIEASGFRSIPDVFKLVPGMYVSYYNGSQAIVSYHGSLSQYAHGMQVLIDGHSVYMPPANTVDWAALPITLDDIERIEIIRGPAASSYGENSVQGVINIITREAGDEHGKSLSLTKGDKGVNDFAVHFGNYGETLDYRMTLAYTADNGYDNLETPPNNIPLSDGGTLLNNTNDNNQARLMNYRASYHPNGVDDIDIQLGFNHDIRGVGFWDSHGGLNPFHDLETYMNTQQIEWLHESSSESESRLRYTHIQHDTNESLQVSNAPASHEIRTGRNEVEVQQFLRISESNRFVYGAGYREDQVLDYIYLPVVAPGYFFLASNTREYHMFAHDEWRAMPRLIINVGGMLENDELGNKRFSPRTSLNYHLNRQKTLRAGVSVAYRTPSLIELLGPALVPGLNSPSPGLQPEKTISRELGYLAEYPDLAVSMDLRIFNDLLMNVIYPTMTAWQNGLTGDMRGVETTIKYAYNEHANLTVNYAHELAYSNYASLVPGQPDLLSESIPKNNISLLYSQRLPDQFTFDFGYYLQSAMQPFDRTSLDFQPTQHRIDIQLRKSFIGPGGLKGEVLGVVQNVFNTAYTEYIATALFNRQAFIKVAIGW